MTFDRSELIDPDGPFYGRDPRAEYLPDPDLIESLNAAITLGMPLLLTGEPGCGKTDFAFAVARKRAGNREGWRATDAARDGLLECYVRSDTKARDLLYHYDALRRFGDANHRGREGAERAADARLYIELMPLGVALAQIAETPARRRVVLIDEIDKAPRDLPNDLLRELDQGSFEIKELTDGDELAAVDDAARRHGPRSSHGVELQRRLGVSDPAMERRPIIIITSNEERQLPDAFLRRCVFHHVEFPRAERLDRILRARFGDAEGIEPAIETFLALRDSHRDILLKRPSTSELITWFHALSAGVYGRGLERLRRFAAEVSLGPGDTFRLDSATLDWRDLPGLGCLLKLKADWDRVARRGAPA